MSDYERLMLCGMLLLVRGQVANGTVRPAEFGAYEREVAGTLQNNEAAKRALAEMGIARDDPTRVRP